MLKCERISLLHWVKRYSGASLRSLFHSVPSLITTGVATAIKGELWKLVYFPLYFHNWKQAFGRSLLD